MKEFERGHIRFENFLKYEKILMWVSFVSFGTTVIWALLSFLTDILPHGMISIFPVFAFGVGIVCMLISLISVLRRYYTRTKREPVEKSL